MNIRDLFLRVRALSSPRRVERELDDEIAFHLERETQKHIGAGLSPADARGRARARFGIICSSDSAPKETPRRTGRFPQLVELCGRCNLHATGAIHTIVQ